MGTYETETANYEVFGANMTVDTQEDTYDTGNLKMCKSCQCNCRLCRGGRAPDDETFTKAETEKALEQLLAA